MIRRRLKFNVLGFEDRQDEYAFFEEFCLANIGFVQASMLIGSILVYVFYLWDQEIDPMHSEITHAIRGLIVVPLIWFLTSLLFAKRARVYFEVIVTLAILTPAIALPMIFSVLAHGFDYGAVGMVLVLMFAFVLLPMRLSYYAILCSVSWLLFDVAEIINGTSTWGIFTINNLCIGTSVILGMISATKREIRARQQFVTVRELDRSRARIDELMQAMLPEGVVDRIKSSISIRSRATHILISYRRADTYAIAGRVRDRLAEYFGKSAIFMDIDSIPVGKDFRRHIASALAETDVLLAVIGPNWVGPLNEGSSSRINDEVDFVRIELELALASDTPILPIVLRGASMPNVNQLPESLKSLAFINAAELDVGRDFQQHMDRIVRSIDELLKIKDTIHVSESGQNAKLDLPRFGETAPGARR